MSTHQIIYRVFHISTTQKQSHIDNIFVTKVPIMTQSSLCLLCSQHPAVRDHALKKTFRSHLKVIKDKNLYHVSNWPLCLHSLHYPIVNLTAVQRIPSYIAMVEWSDISSLEVYSLLHNLEDVISSIPIAVSSGTQCAQLVHWVHSRL